jgi:hypothetical protein
MKLNSRLVGIWQNYSCATYALWLWVRSVATFHILVSQNYLAENKICTCHPEPSHISSEYFYVLVTFSFEVAMRVCYIFISSSKYRFVICAEHSRNGSSPSHTQWSWHPELCNIRNVQLQNELLGSHHGQPSLQSHVAGASIFLEVMWVLLLEKMVLDSLFDHVPNCCSYGICIQIHLMPVWYQKIAVLWMFCFTFVVYSDEALICVGNCSISVFFLSWVCNEKPKYQCLSSGTFLLMMD